ncbi:MAG: hypothetical protein AB1671_13105, partial [Thermodesulfobacteriota bacterium]
MNTDKFDSDEREHAQLLRDLFAKYPDLDRELPGLAQKARASLAGAWYVDSVLRARAERARAGITASDPSRSSQRVTAPPWPSLAEEALHGLAGDIVRTIDPFTEADPVAT